MKNTRGVPTFAEVADQWWTVEATGKQRVREPYRSENSRVNAWVKVFDTRSIDAVNIGDVNGWIAKRLQNNIAISTINRDLKPLRWILNYAVDCGYIPVNPLGKLKDLKGAVARIRWMSEDELRLLMKAAWELCDFGLADVITVGVNTGFRKGNLERLEGRDIRDEKITAQKTKSGHPYDVPIASAVRPVLARLLTVHPTGPLLNTYNLDARFRAVAKHAGLYADKKDVQKVTIHTLRHTFAALYLKRGGDIYKLSKLLGHASVVITEKVYGHICPRDMAAQAALISTQLTEETI